jgi:hypothetical protein
VELARFELLLETVDEVISYFKSLVTHIPIPDFTLSIQAN